LQLCTEGLGTSIARECRESLGPHDQRRVGGNAVHGGEIDDLSGRRRARCEPQYEK
jgi:hypothetical protein